MFALIKMLKELIARWSLEQETAVRQTDERKTLRGRLAAFGQSEHVEAKFYLLALAPYLPLLVSDQVGWPRGTIWHRWFWLSSIWAAMMVGLNLLSFWRGLWGSSHRKE